MLFRCYGKNIHVVKMYQFVLLSSLYLGIKEAQKDRFLSLPFSSTRKGIDIYFVKMLICIVQYQLIQVYNNIIFLSDSTKSSYEKEERRRRKKKKYGCFPKVWIWMVTKLPILSIDMHQRNKMSCLYGCSID